LQRERHGTLLVDNERRLDMFLRGLWQDEDLLIPYSSAFDECASLFHTTTSWAFACRMFTRMTGVCRELTAIALH